jgi:TolC family type I secretion outer membrane protein
MSRSLLTAFCGLVAAGMLSPAGGQTLEQALVAAYLDNPRLEAQRAGLRASDELVPQALAGWRPTVRLNSAANLTEQRGSTGGGGLTTLSHGLRVEQPVYRGGETTANTRRAENLVRLERARLVQVEQEVLLEAVAAYTAVLRDQAVLDLAVSNEQRLRRQLDAARDRFSVGEVTRTDVAQAEARVAGAVAERIRAEGDLLAARATFEQVIGSVPGERLVRPDLPALPGSEVEAQNLAELNPSLVGARFSLAAAGDDVDVALSALRPRVTVSGELAYVDEPSRQIDWQRSASIGAQLTVPLYQGGGEHARVRQNRQVVGQRQSDLDRARRLVREEVTSAWEALQTARARIASFEEQVRANEIALEGVRQEALVGARTTLDVLDAEQEAFASEVDLTRARRDMVVAAYRLKAAVGQLTVADLGLPVEPFDDQAHYRVVRDKWFGLEAAGSE